MADFPEEILEGIVNSVRNLFLCNGVSSVELETSKSINTKDVDYHSVMEIDGNDIQGNITFESGKNLLMNSHPNNMMNMPVNSEDVLDWVGEAANQIVGRFKNDMFDHGLVFNMTTPEVFEGRCESPQKTADDMMAKKLKFKVDGELFFVELLLKLNPDFVFKHSGGSAAQEGSAILF